MCPPLDFCTKFEKSKNGGLVFTQEDISNLFWGSICICYDISFMSFLFISLVLFTFEN